MYASLWMLSLCSAGQVWIVEAPGGVRTTVQPTIDAAADGDLILLRSGEYWGFTIDGKSLRVQADVGADVEVYGSVTVRNLVSTGFVLLGGFEVEGFGSQPVSDPGLELIDNLGFVRLEDCEIHGGYGNFSALCNEISDGGPGVHAAASARVVLTRCTIAGGQGGEDYYGSCDSGAGGNGVSSSDSTLATYDCSIFGGGGGQNLEAYGSGVGGRGGQGCLHVGGQLFASRTLFEGGNGGVHWNGGDGGDGLEVNAAEADLRSCVYHAGHGAAGIAGSNGQDGQIRTGDGDFVFLNGPARIFSAPLLVADNGTLPITVVGLAGDRVWIVRSKAPAHRFVPAFGGLRLARAPAFMSVEPLGIVPATGPLEIDLPIPRLSSGTTFDADVYQGIVQDTAGRFFLCGALHPTVFRCAGLVPDCNANGKFDTCDILSGVSTDCDRDGHPDDCEPDCNGNGVADDCDLANGTSVDLNANGILDECEPNRTWFVDASAAAGGDGSAARPFQSIGAAIPPSISGDTVLVRDGVYGGGGNRNLGLGGRNLVIRSEHGAAACTIDCQLSGRAFLIDHFETAAARIQGFTIRNGSNPLGGAIRVMSSDVTIAECSFVNCGTDGGSGGALLLEFSRSEVRDCVFTGNRAEVGGALESEGGEPWIHRCTFENNTATRRGGAVYALALSFMHGPLISECRFFGNHADISGGALLLGGSIQAGYRPARLVQCLLAGNTAPTGSALNCNSGVIRVFDDTITGGQAATSSTIWIENTSNVGIVNSILWNNASSDGKQATLSGPSGTLRVGFSIFQGGQAAVAAASGSTLIWGAGILDADPRFVDADGADGNPLTYGDNDYRLAAASPCLDAGDNTEVPADVKDLNGNANVTEPWPFDFDGLARFVDQVGVPDTGVGPPPIVDMGCYERP